MINSRTGTSPGRFDYLRLIKLVRGYRMRGANASQGSLSGMQVCDGALRVTLQQAMRIRK
jgi:hypothetical protein